MPEADALWDDIGVYNDDTLRAVIKPLTGIGAEDSWECYGGWLISQGRKFYEAAMRDPELAAWRLRQ